MEKCRARRKKLPFSKTFAETKGQKGFEMDPLEGKKFEEAYLGGKQVKEYLNEGVPLSELQSYKPLELEKIRKKYRISLPWILFEMDTPGDVLLCC